jgi:hypothetical protein
MKINRIKVSIITLWVSFIGSLILVIATLGIIVSQIRSFYHRSYFVFWHPNPDVHVVWLVLLAIAIWLLFPSLFLFSFFYNNQRGERQKLYLVSGLSNLIQLIVLPLMVFYLIQFNILIL